MASSYTLGQHFEGFVQSLVKSGRYSTASEVMRDGLRLLEEREAMKKEQLKALRAAIKEGIESGPSIPAEEVFKRLEAKYSKES